MYLVREAQKKIENLKIKSNNRALRELLSGDGLIENSTNSRKIPTSWEVFCQNSEWKFGDSRKRKLAGNVFLLF